MALEHLRVLASSALGQCQAIILGLHNTPFGDIVDAEDDIQPTVRSTFDYTSRVLDLLTEVLRSASFNQDQALSKCRGGEITLTELADWLVRVHHLPFRTSHQIVCQVAAELQRTPSRRFGESLSQRVCNLTEMHSQSILGWSIQISPEQMSEILDPVRFVESRTIIGGPSPHTVFSSTQSHARELDVQLVWLKKQEQNLRDYSRQLTSL